MLRVTGVLTARIVKREILSAIGACSSRNEGDGFDLVDVIRDNGADVFRYGNEAYRLAYRFKECQDQRSLMFQNGVIL